MQTWGEKLKNKWTETTLTIHCLSVIVFSLILYLWFLILFCSTSRRPSYVHLYIVTYTSLFLSVTISIYPPLSSLSNFLFLHRLLVYVCMLELWICISLYKLSLAVSIGQILHLEIGIALKTTYHLRPFILPSDVSRSISWGRMCPIRVASDLYVALCRISIINPRFSRCIQGFSKCKAIKNIFIFNSLFLTHFITLYLETFHMPSGYRPYLRWSSRMFLVSSIFLSVHFIASRV